MDVLSKARPWSHLSDEIRSLFRAAELSDDALDMGTSGVVYVLDVTERQFFLCLRKSDVLEFNRRRKV